MLIARVLLLFDQDLVNQRGERHLGPPQTLQTSLSQSPKAPILRYVHFANGNHIHEGSLELPKNNHGLPPEVCLPKLIPPAGR